MKAADLLSIADHLIRVERCDEAARVLGNVLGHAGPRDRPRVVTMLKRIAGRSTTAACNLGIALLRGDGVKADPEHGARLLRDVLDQGDPGTASFAHNTLGHYRLETFGTATDARAALSHFERAGGFGQGEAAFNAGLLLEKGMPGIRRNVRRAISNYRTGVLHGSAKAMTNLALLVMAGKVSGCGPHHAVDLLESASELGDTQADVILLLIDADAVAFGAGESRYSH